MDDTPTPDPLSRPTRRLTIDVSELTEALDNSSWEAHYFLDRETGRVILISADTHRQYDAVCADIGHVPAAEWPAAFEAALQAADLADWEVPLVRDVDQVETGSAERFIQVPRADSREGYQDMEAFIATVSNARLADRLARAIQGRGVFRRFKDALLEHPVERERWFAFRDARQRERLLDWLASEYIELDSGPAKA
jgi:hypothetical protein